MTPAPIKYQAGPVEDLDVFGREQDEEVIPKKCPEGRVKLRPWSAVPVSTPRIMTALKPKNAAL